MKTIAIILFLSSLLLGGCQSSGEDDLTATPSPQDTPTTIVIPPSPTFMPTATSLPTPTATPEAQRICSPLQGYSLADLEAAIVNPYQPPPPGSDRPHQALDLAIMQPESHIALAGGSVHAILGGVVRAVIVDRFPYGNAILVETSLQAVDGPENILAPIPTPWAEVKPDPALTCPVVAEQPLVLERTSIYILYAHLLEAPTLAVDEVVDCGETIGKIGMSGNALNPHVHIESRLGPANAHFESMAHYDSSATINEMSAYCQWRVSGIFQHFDPMLILNRLSPSFSP